MQRAQQRFEHEEQRVPRGVGRGRVAAVQRRLGEFEEPVAELVPGEFVQRLRDQVEAVGGELRFDLGERAAAGA